MFLEMAVPMPKAHQKDGPRLAKRRAGPLWPRPSVGWVLGRGTASASSTRLQLGPTSLRSRGGSAHRAPRHGDDRTSEAGDSLGAQRVSSTNNRGKRNTRPQGPGLTGQHRAEAGCLSAGHSF